ncbi:phospholipase D family protein [Arenimonas daejeonensis]|uniref:phospholipase D family protein n=1 Tax=Arenimonas daejeonensis TaxID=370777 RepID=UPI0011BF9FA1|nr:phospholipase D family protein [Arenimonas daejeonensis]
MRLVWSLALTLGLVACAQLPPRLAVPEQTASPPATTGTLAERVAPAELRHPGQSGFRLVATGTEAYALRAFSAQSASRSLDIQTYIWHNDLTGRLLARHALLAADRGVNVRILVDDLDARAKNDGFAALDAHPRIEVRLYNPLASRHGSLRKAGEFSAGFSRLNHRMHNKTWIADNLVALVGGRNLGDEYFDAHDGTNFMDLDFLMAGPVVRAASANFDRYWNSDSNYPIAQLAPDQIDDDALQRLRTFLDTAAAEHRSGPYLQVLREDPDVANLIDGETTLHWTADWGFVSDDPKKSELPVEQRSGVLKALKPALDGAQHEVALISPYFVPGESGSAYLQGLAARGLDVRILTNSLAATDVAAVHGGYMRYRPTLLENGVRLWELKPTGAGTANFSLAGSSGSSLHTKAMIIDDRQVFVGSYNIDPRSTSLNNEQGVLASHPALAAELTALFERQLTGDLSWQVTLVDGQLSWSDGRTTWDKEPQSKASQRVLAWLMKVLPVESQL